MSLAERRPRQPRDFAAAYDAAITAVAFSETDVLAVALGDGSIQLIGPDGTVRAEQVHGGAALCLAVDIDGHGFITGGDDGRLVRSAIDGSACELLSAPGRQIDVLAVSRPANARAVAIGREVRLLDATGGVRTCASSHPSTVSGLAFNPKGKRLAVSHYGGVTLWWTNARGGSPQRMEWRGSHIGVTWSPNGAYVMTAMQECELHGWRLADGESMALSGYATKVRSMDWLARPAWLVTAGARSVVAWPFAGSGPQGKAPIELCRGVGRLATRVAVHPKQPLVAAGFDDGSVAVCALPNQVDDGIFRIRPSGGGQVTALAWSRDGRQLAIGTEAGILSLFDLSYADG
jgi:WD40 repeat protein